MRSTYMANVVDKSYPFAPATQTNLTAALNSLVPLYANLATGGNTDLALKQLKAQLREHVVWERNTVWREMIGLERKGWGAAGSGAAGHRTGMEVPMVENKGEDAATSWMWNPQVWAGAAAVLLFVAILNVDWFDRVEEQNCLALLAFVTIFWALEVRRFLCWNFATGTNHDPCRSYRSLSPRSWSRSSSSCSASCARQTARTDG